MSRAPEYELEYQPVWVKVKPEGKLSEKYQTQPTVLTNARWAWAFLCLPVIGLVGTITMTVIDNHVQQLPASTELRRLSRDY